MINNTFLLLSLFFAVVSASQHHFATSEHVTDESDLIPLKEDSDRFTPKDFIELIRPGTAVANPAGDVALIPVSKYNTQNRVDDKKILVFSIQPSHLSADKFASIADGQAFWLDSGTIGHIVSNEKSKVQELYTVNIKRESNDSVSTASSSFIGEFPLSDLANFQYSPQAESLVFSTYAWPDANISTIKEQDKAFENRGHSARVYDRPFVRHWDTYKGPKTQTLFSVTLKKVDGIWSLGNDYVSLLKGTQHSTPVGPFGGTNNFAVSGTHVVYTTKDPNVNPATHTRQDIYLVPIKGGERPKRLTSGIQGDTDSPVFDKQGTKVAWTEMAEDGNEADRAKIVIYDLEKEVRFTLTPHWDRSASQISFSSRGDKIILTAAEHARNKIFSIDVIDTPSVTDANVTVADPVALTSSHSVSHVQPLEDGSILFMRSSLTSPNEVFLYTENSSPKIQQITRLTEQELHGKSLSVGEDFWATGGDGFNVHSWVLKPYGYVEGQKYPVVFIVHGGPQSATEDGWSTRWNPNVFAQQGYFVVAPNPTGSTGFGQEFSRRVTLNWGSRPFVDLIAVWKAVLEAYPDMDGDNAAAAGPSYGGYAMNWINGHPELGFNFKALVCHDGLFDTRYFGFSTDELYFSNYEFGGPAWAHEEHAQRYNPSLYIDKYSTPQLLIQGSLDFRLIDADSLGVFSALQQRGIDTRLVIFPDENHWVLKHENSLKWHQEVFGWIAKYTTKA